jgi:outer membrane protein TolC
MKHVLLATLCSLLLNPLFAQMNAPDKKMASNPSMAERLVNLAMQNPQLEVADHEVNISQYKLKEEKGWWASSISLSFNANEFTIKRLENKQAPTGGLYPYYPFYNVGVSIPIGGIISKPFSVKAAREGVAIARAQRNSAYRQIRAAVLSAYNDYLANQELLTIQSQLTESSYNDYLQAKEKFRNGQVSVDDYNKAIQNYHDQLANRIGAQHNLNADKIQLEQLIGQPLDKVLADSSGADDQHGSPAAK